MKVARRPCFSAQHVVVVPVHLELAVGVLVVVLIGAPAELQHAVANLADHVVAAHQGRLVVAGLVLDVALVRDRGAVRVGQEVFALHADLGPEAGFVGPGDLALEGDPGRILDLLAVHPEVARNPSDLGLPRQLDEARRIGDGEHVRVRRGHVEPGGEAGETGAVLLHAGNSARRHQLGAQHPEEVDEGDQEIADLAILRHLGKVVRGGARPPAALLYHRKPPC
jgi:hypothetical protein